MRIVGHCWMDVMAIMQVVVRNQHVSLAGFAHAPTTSPPISVRVMQQASSTSPIRSTYVHE